MTLRKWAIKPGELKRLARPDLLLFSVRCALRYEPWRVESAAQLWEESLALVVALALDGVDPMPPGDIGARARALRNVGARECNRLEAIDAPLGRCQNYAHDALAEAVYLTALTDRKAVVKGAIDSAKLSASIGATWAHAGRVPVPAGQDAVDLTSSVTWGAIRADVATLADAAAVLARHPAPARVAALRAIAPLWPEGSPSWAAPPSSPPTPRRPNGQGSRSR